MSLLAIHYTWRAGATCMWAMNGMNRHVVTYKPVEFETKPFEVQGFQENFRSFEGTLWNIFEINEGKLEDFNM